MALFIPGPLISKISGRVGQSVFSSYKGVGVVKQAATSVYNPNSPAQTAARTAASYIAQQWPDLSEEAQAGWDDDAQAEKAEKENNAWVSGCKSSIFKGHPGPMSGFNMFLMRNYNRYSAGISALTDILQDAPLGLYRPEGLDTTSVAIAGRTIVFSWTLITNAPTSNRLKLWIRSIDAKIHVQLAATAPVYPAGSITISTVRSISGLPILLPPGKYQLQAQVVDIHGKESVDSEILNIRLRSTDFMPQYFPTRILLIDETDIDADTGWIPVDVSGYIATPPTAILIYVEVQSDAPMTSGQYALVEIRKDSTQGVCMQKQLNRDPALDTLIQGSGIIPVTPAEIFEYQITGVYV